MKKQECIEKYGIEEYLRRLEKTRQWRIKNPNKIVKQNEKYHKEHPDFQKEYYQANLEHELERNRKYKEEHKEEVKDKVHFYQNETKNGRARHLIGAYSQSDKKHNRGECTITSDWIINNIFNNTCIYCGESDWHKLGCDRIDNSKPHTEDNCVCSCKDCNIKRGSDVFYDYYN